MSDQTPLKNAFNQPKQFWALFLILLIVFLAFVFTLLKSGRLENPQKETSLEQALTLVAGASQTAQAANPNSSSSGLTTQAAHSNPSATKTFVGAFSLSPSSINTTQITSTLSSSSQAFMTATSNRVIPSQSSNKKIDNNTQEPSPTFPVGNVTVRPTYTPKPTETIRPEDSPTPKPTSTATPGPGLPGLSMTSVIGRLKNEKGFACKQEGNAPSLTLWMCDVQIGNDLWYHVDLYGNSTIEITNLFVSVFQTHPNDAKSIDILSFVASLPYTGSDAAAASKWVEQTLPGIQSIDDVKEKIIGGVRFKLYGGPQGRYLEMGEPAQQ